MIRLQRSMGIMDGVGTYRTWWSQPWTIVDTDGRILLKIQPEGQGAMSNNIHPLDLHGEKLVKWIEL
jgi:hypothetical protein